MDATWIEVGGLLITKPVSAGTNLVLAVQCSAHFWSRRSSADDRVRLWSLFFLYMSVATLAGVPKHGLHYLMSDAAFDVVLWISNVGAGLSTWYAQRATIGARAPRRLRRPLRRVAALQLGLFLAANVVMGPEMSLLIAHTAFGLVPVIGFEWRAYLGGVTDAAWVAVGLSLSSMTAGVYLTGLTLGPWMGPIDIAHFLMGASFWLIAVGCPAGTRRAEARRPLGAPVEVVSVAPTGGSR